MVVMASVVKMMMSVWGAVVSDGSDDCGYYRI